MKPYVRPRPLVNKPKRDAEMKEVRRDRNTMLVAGISLLVSAASALFAYGQVDLLRRERATPFRAILYQSKLDAYKDVVPTMHAYSEASDQHSAALWIMYQTTKFNHETKLGRPTDGTVVLIKSKGDKEHLPAFSVHAFDYDAGALLSEAKPLRSALLTAAVVWPKRIQDMFDKVRGDFSDQDECLSSLEISKRAFQKTKGTVTPREDQFLNSTRCFSNFWEKSGKLAAEFTVLDNAMKADLKAEQLQAVPALSELH